MSLEVEKAQGPAQQLRRYDITARILAAVRQGSNERWKALQEDLSRHYRRLALFGFAPGDLHADVGLSSGVRWSARRLYLMGIPFIALALIGHIAFWVPFSLTRLLTAKARPELDRVSTYKLLFGIVTYSVWVATAALASMWVWGLGTGVAMLVLLPPLGVADLWIRERWRWGFSDVRRFMILHTRRYVIDELFAEQKRLGSELKALFEAWDSGPVY
jgi:hypothetical protein